MRIDFRGEGDSGRCFEESSLATAWKTPRRDRRAQEGRAALLEVSMLGLRFGSAVAALAGPAATTSVA